MLDGLLNRGFDLERSKRRSTCFNVYRLASIKTNSEFHPLLFPSVSRRKGWCYLHYGAICPLRLVPSRDPLITNWQRELKDGSPGRICPRGEPSSVSFDNRTADR
jgi:hypothetical protein